MRLSDLVYDLPADLIAQEPAHERGDSRLLVVGVTTDALEHTRITALPALLRAGDLLVLNDTRVIAARVRGARPERRPARAAPVRAARMTGGGLALVKGSHVSANASRSRRARGEWVADCGDGRWQVRLDVGPSVLGGSTRSGRYRCRRTSAVRTARPPWTVIGTRRSSRASPAPSRRRRPGLHFTPALFDALAARGVEHTFVTLHVGPGTFQPIRGDDLTTFRMAAERSRSASPRPTAIGRARAEGRRIVAVGTRPSGRSSRSPRVARCGPRKALPTCSSRRVTSSG
jgi:S-adenosylmethionine:tRNA ribosyltransferase-isomerase